MTQDVLWRLVVTLRIVAQVASVVFAFIRMYRLEGAAVAFTPGLLALSILYVNAQDGWMWPLPPIATLVLAITVLVPLVAGFNCLRRGRKPSYPLWIGWTLTWVPLAVVALMVCCFKMEIW